MEILKCKFLCIEEAMCVINCVNSKSGADVSIFLIN